MPGFDSLSSPNGLHEAPLSTRPIVIETGPGRAVYWLQAEDADLQLLLTSIHHNQTRAGDTCCSVVSRAVNGAGNFTMPVNLSWYTNYGAALNIFTNRPSIMIFAEKHSNFISAYYV